MYNFNRHDVPSRVYVLYWKDRIHAGFSVLCPIYVTMLHRFKGVTKSLWTYWLSFGVKRVFVLSYALFTIICLNHFLKMHMRS